MADAKKLVPGTWFVTVTQQGRPEPRYTIITFTSDGGMVERAEPLVEAAIGVWESGDSDDEFRFMFYRFLETLTITEPEEEKSGQKEEQEAVTVRFANIMRLRSTNHLTSDDSFEGTATADFLDAAGALVTAIPGFSTTHRAVRLKLVRQ